MSRFLGLKSISQQPGQPPVRPIVQVEVTQHVAAPWGGILLGPHLATLLEVNDFIDALQRDLEAIRSEARKVLGGV